MFKFGALTGASYIHTMSEKRILAVINCTSSKNKPEPGGTIAAEDMYSASPTFKVQREFVSEVYDNWCILSAGYGLIPPTQQIEMYDAILHEVRQAEGRLITEEEKLAIRKQVSKVLDKALEQYDAIHFHVGTIYWDTFVEKKYQNNPKIIQIKKQKNNSSTRSVYREGLEKYKNGDSLNEVIKYLNTLKESEHHERESEQAGWWYHPIEDPVYGKSDDLALKHSLNNGNLFMHYHQDTVQSKHVKGWTNVLENLQLLKKTEDGWRLRSEKDPLYVTDERIEEIKKYILDHDIFVSSPKSTLSLTSDGVSPHPNSNYSSNYTEKSNLISIINKYYLNGLCESVKWNVKDKELTINAVLTTKNAITKLTCNNIGIEDSELCIFNTTQLLSLLSITDDFLELKVESKQLTPIKLNIADNQYDLSYHLSDSSIIPSVATIEEPINYDFEFDINNEFIVKFIKSYAALDKNPRFTMQAHLTPESKEVEIVMGAAEQHANKIKFKETGEFIMSTDPIPFPANIFKEIFSANKEGKGTVYVSNQGLSKITFEEEPISVTYFVARNNN